MFTICGHVMLYQYFVYRSDKLFNEQISKNLYNVNDLVQIKVPIHTSILQNWNSFERINGQVQFKNTCYNYVKLKLTRDTIYLMCVPNYEKTRLVNQNIINASQIADIPVNKKDHVPFGKTTDLGNYNYTIILYNFSAPVITLKVNNKALCYITLHHFIAIPHQPPKMFC